MEEFFASVLPPEGPYVLATIKNGNVKHSTHMDFKSMSSAAAKHPVTGADSYVCISSIKDVDFISDAGKKVPRNQKNVKATRSLILDLDVDATDTKKFSSKEEALRTLFAFQQALHFTEPTVLDSGYGIHVWWPFEEPAKPNDWLKAAIRLRMVATHFDSRLTADPTRIMDSASLLRTPNTINFKRGSKEKTKVISIGVAQSYTTFDLAFKYYIKENKLETIQKEKAREKEEKEKEKRNFLMVSSDEPHSFVHVLKKCNWIKEYIKNKANESEPNWYAMLGIMPYLKTKTHDGLQLAHMMSEGHKGYDGTATERKYKQARDAQTGPTTCEKFRQLSPKRCEGCPYAKMVNTPVRLDIYELPAPPPIITMEVVRDSGEIEQELIPIPKPPEPYYRGKDGMGIYVKIGEGDEQEVQRIYEYDIFPVRRLKDEETDNEMLEISLTLPVDGHRFIKVPSGCLTDPKQLAKALAEKGVLLQQRDIPKLTAYIIEYARKIQREEKAHEEFARFGWRDIDTDTPRFVMGDFIIDSKGDMRRATPAGYLKQYKDVLSIKGDLEEWKAGFNIYTGIPNSEPLQFALMMAFAAPLFALTSFHGLVYNMLGDSGCGKSTALKFMSSVWGKPLVSHIQTRDNVIPMLNTLGYLQSIPVSFDELTTISSDALTDFVYAVTEGRGKNRADKTGNTRLNTVQWKTVVCATSNASLYEKLAMSRAGNNAHAYRVFEVHVSPAKEEFRTRVNKALERIEGNYGIAGRVYISYVIKNLKQIRQDVLDTAIDFAGSQHMPTAERFWFTLFACIAVGAKIAERMKLHSYDTKTIIDWTIKQITKVREIVSTVEGDAFSTFAHFMQTNLRSTLVVHDGKANPLNMDGNPIFNLLIRLELHEGKPSLGWVAVPAIKDFCRHMQVEYGWMLKKLEEAKLLIGIEGKKLGDGTNISTGTTKCWKIDLQHATMRGG